MNRTVSRGSQTQSRGLREDTGLRPLSSVEVETVESLSWGACAAGHGDHLEMKSAGQVGSPAVRAARAESWTEAGGLELPDMPRLGEKLPTGFYVKHLNF